MIRLVLMLGSTPAFAGAFGGAELGASMEMDAFGAAYLMDLQVESFRQNKGDNRLIWAPFSVSFELGDTAPLSHVDQLDLALITGGLSFENTLVNATYGAGLVHWDSEGEWVDLTAAQGGVSFPIWGDLLRAAVGLDLRGRALLPEGAENSFQLSMGVPLGLFAETGGERPQFASAELGFRPGLGLLGETQLNLNARAQTRIGYAIVQADAVELRCHLSYGFEFDNATAAEAFWAHRFGAAFSAVF